jgi:pSer/pThr/pTyr-binding forkhead associated (FHA) protein
MPITVIVRVAAREGVEKETRLTFDGTQRVVIGRGAGSDIRLPDPSVSHRHASIRGQGGDFAVIDEGSTNGTYVGDVKIAPRTSRTVRSGDKVRVGRVWIELRIDQTPATRDVAGATRDLALALVSRAMDAMGTDPTPRIRVVEGRDAGAVLPLAEEGRTYVVGRAPESDLALTDSDCSREHVHVVLRGGAVLLRDRAAKNGTFVGELRVADEREVSWRPTTMVRIGRTVLALEDPVTQALADLERATDEPLAPDEEPALPPADVPSSSAGDATDAASALPLASVPVKGAGAASRGRSRWSMTDTLVMAAAVGVLVLSLAGLVWLLHG